MLTEKGKNFFRGLLIYGMYIGIFWEILFGWKETIHLIAYLLGYEIVRIG